MNKLISSINFELYEDPDKNITKEINDQYKFEGTAKEISDLSKVNLMVGSNNSGKSRFIRRIFEIRELNFKLNSSYFDQKFKEIENILNCISTTINTYEGKVELKGRYSSFDNEAVSALQKSIKIDFLEGFTEGEYLFKGFIEEAKKFIKSYDGFSREINQDKKEEASACEYTKSSFINEDIEKLRSIVDCINIFKDERIKFKKVYIPILRGLLPISPDGDIYASLIKKKYFDDRNVEIFTGLNLYDDIMDMLLGNLEEREMIKEFQIFLSEAFFNKQEVLIIPRRGENQVIFIKIGDEEEYPIYDLGDGLQALIILTFPLFKYKNEKLLLFIEEPELNLHPGMQRKLIEILYRDVSNTTQFFMTTHSNHLLDMTLDSNNVSVYTFNKNLNEGAGRSKKSKVNVVNVSSETHNPLELLGVKNSAVFLTNCTVWVEGITDRLYIRRYLEVYQEQFKESERYLEDIHYSFVEYSGNNITHWRFLEEDGMNQDTLCGKLFLISDLDGMTQAELGDWTTVKRKRHKKLEQVLQDRYKCLECREIENLLSPAILEAVICEYEKLDPLSEDYLIAPILYEEYKNELLGNYIESKLKEKKRKGSYASSSGTVSDKTNFCKKAIAKIEKFEDLSPEAQELTKTLYQFIKQHND